MLNGSKHADACAALQYKIMGQINIIKKISQVSVKEHEFGRNTYSRWSQS